MELIREPLMDPIQVELKREILTDGLKKVHVNSPSSLRYKQLLKLVIKFLDFLEFKVLQCLGLWFFVAFGMYISKCNINLTWRKECFNYPMPSLNTRA